MRNSDRLIAEIERRPGSTDHELRAATGVEPHQQVNQICRRLADQGRIVRRLRSDGRVGNFPLGASTAQASADGGPPCSVAVETDWSQFGRGGRDRSRFVGPPLPPPGSSVVVVPCSKAKRSGGVPGTGSLRLVDRLPDATRDALLASREVQAGSVRLDETLLMPAVTRYDGHLYRVAGHAMREATLAGRSILVLSGFYGVVDALDPIGTYERALHTADWPAGVLEGALIDAVRSCGHRDAVVFCSQSTNYATVVRRARWTRSGLRCWLVSPDADGRGGAQRSVPKATGEAIVAFLEGRLDADWSSSEGLALTIEALA